MHSEGTELWLVDLAASLAALLHIEQVTPRLSAEDLAKCDRMGSTTARQERRSALIALRVLIERAFGAEWRRVPYIVSPEGKPSLPGATFGFSLSHVAGLALIALGAEGPVGVDLERRRPVTLSSDRRRQIEDGAAALAPALPLPLEGEARFLQAWVRLEAVAKADGRGLGPLLTSLGVTRSGSGQPPAGAVAPFTVYDVSVGESLFAAIALVGPAPAPCLQRLPELSSEIEALIRR